MIWRGQQEISNYKVALGATASASVLVPVMSAGCELHFPCGGRELGYLLA